MYMSEVVLNADHTHTHHTLYLNFYYVATTPYRTQLSSGRVLAWCVGGREFNSQPDHTKDDHTGWSSGRALALCAAGCRFNSQPGHTKDFENGT